MVRTLFAVMFLTLLSLSVGCPTREIDSDDEIEFTANPEAAKSGAQQSAEKGFYGQSHPEAAQTLEKTIDTTPPDQGGN